jgi:hypothetical protein
MNNEVNVNLAVHSVNPHPEYWPEQPNTLDKTHNLFVINDICIRRHNPPILSGVVCCLEHKPIRRTTMYVQGNYVSTSTRRDLCYACLREFHEDDLGACMVCGENLCLDLPACSGKCRCDEEAEQICNAHTQGISPVASSLGT